MWLFAVFWSLAVLMFYPLASEDFMRLGSQILVLSYAWCVSVLGLNATRSEELGEEPPLKSSCPIWYYVASPEFLLPPRNKQDSFPVGVAFVWWSVVISYGTILGVVVVLYFYYRPRGNESIRTLEELVKAILQNRIKENEIGCRVKKCRYIQQQEQMKLVITLAPLPESCILDLKRYEFLATLRHPNVQRITRILYVEETNQVAIAQPFWEHTGSLRDLIYRENPAHNWAKKYTGAGTGLSLEKVRTYGRQILEGVSFLYKILSNEIKLQPLGHIHTGNIYLGDAGNCLVGGYENILLQYKTRLHKKIPKRCLPDMDIILFGHVIYEMAMGKEMSGVFPKEADYAFGQYEGDDLEEMAEFAEKCKMFREILEFIFARKKDGRLAHSIKKIMGRNFFATPSERAKTGLFSRAKAK